MSEERIDEDQQDYFCIVCEKKTNNYGDCRSNINGFQFGYGSKQDYDKVDVTICDDCIKEKHKKGIVGNFYNVANKQWGRINPETDEWEWLDDA